MSAGIEGARELALRENDGVRVRLLWHPDEDAVSVTVEDTRTDHQFELVVERRRALQVFYHPFAYAA
jgi:hypothetical protein